MRLRNLSMPVLIVITLSALAWALLEARQPGGGPGDSRPSQSAGPTIFTPAHRQVLDALKDFFAWHPEPVQPIAFTHKVHLAKGLQCTDCHTSVGKGPVAGIPSVKLCMTCHEVIATDRPEIKKMAGYLARGEEIPWQRVYDFSPTAHVKFYHASHIRAGVNCAICHGDMTQQTVASRAVNLTMGYCIGCHKLKKASVDCLTCHF